MFLLRRILWTNPVFLFGALLLIILGLWTALELVLGLKASPSWNDLQFLLAACSVGCLTLGWILARAEDNRGRARFL